MRFSNPNATLMGKSPLTRSIVFTLMLFITLPSMQIAATERPVSSEQKAAAPQATWTVVPGTRLRAQIAQWLVQANAGATGATGAAGKCGAARCYRLAEASQLDGAEPWKITVDDSYEGDFLGALTWLRDGFWASPRPDIEVTQNNVIVLRALGARNDLEIHPHDRRCPWARSRDARPTRRLVSNTRHGRSRPTT